MANIEKLLSEEYKKHISNDNKNPIDFDKQIFQYSTLIKETEQVYFRLKLTLQDIPIVVVLSYWLSKSAYQVNQKQFSKQILTLIEKNVLSIRDAQNHLRTLGHIQEEGEQGHKRIIEEIRCLQDLSVLLKEDLVKCYIDLFDHLNQSTFGIIPRASDPNQFYASYKVISYENFKKFTQFLSERDALIAKLLYFGGPTVEEVLFLTYEQLNFDNYCIKFSKQSMIYPKHLMLELLNFVGKKKKKDPIFINYKGKQVVRTHLNHSFGRASKNINLVITPRDLVKLKLNNVSGS